MIGLIDVDGHNFPNLALMKISAWHKQQGDCVEWWNGLKNYNTVYMSKVFDSTYTTDMEYCINADRVIKGGTGYGLSDSLPEKIEHMMPDYSLYEITNTAYGFLTRGCPRQCKFCIVSQKEGPISQKVANLSEFWSGQREIKLLDPNILACKDHENLLLQLVGSKAWVDFTQGLDVRLITKENVQLLNQIKTKMIHFAWDNPKQDLTEHFARFNKLSKLNDRRKKCVYVLTNFGSTHEEDLNRVYALRELGYDPYVMIYDKPHAPKVTRHLQRWVNNKRIFRTIEKFEDYDYRIG
ncbi:MAG: radical SAM protein [Aminipila sp.]